MSASRPNGTDRSTSDWKVRANDGFAAEEPGALVRVADRGHELRRLIRLQQEAARARAHGAGDGAGRRAGAGDDDDGFGTVRQDLPDRERRLTGAHRDVDDDGVRARALGPGEDRVERDAPRRERDPSLGERRARALRRLHVGVDELEIDGQWAQRLIP